MLQVFKTWGCFSCWHRAAAICEKRVSFKLHIFIDLRHLREKWKFQCEGLECFVLNNAYLNAVTFEAKKLLNERRVLKLPVTIYPSHGRLPKNASETEPFNMIPNDVITPLIPNDILTLRVVFTT